ncbi:hypothetical protein [Devosia nitrariae]|uniref:Uncharacterized protein n=2 Tax=Devosia nitrariae TaxID=2071872 RepID=A0ABQ5W0Z7_9HYPH|nr:hypothetical protein GCM10010862_06510 [Devosia nitrariae]
MMRTSPCLGMLLLPLLAAPVLAQDAGQQPPTEQQVEQPAFSGELDAPTSGEGVTVEGTPVPTLTVPPDPRDLLTGLYATKGLAEICGIAIDAKIQEAMSADEAKYVANLGITAEAAGQAYDEIKSTLEAREPDCGEGSGDVAGVTEVLDLYAAEPQAEAQPASQSTSAPAEPAPAPASQ